jgi:aspartyl-tRNA synthetase
MESKKKIGIRLFVTVCVITVAVCMVIQATVKNEDKKQEAESQRDEILIVESNSGNIIETEYVHIDNKFYLKIPKNFNQLDYDTIIGKYGGDVPDIVYSNDDININIAVSLTENPMKNSQIEEFTKYMEKLFEGYSEIVDTNYYTVSNHNVGQIKLISNAIDTKVYNNMIFFSYHDKLVIVTFNCTDKLKDEWSSVGDFIMDSLSFESS